MTATDMSERVFFDNFVDSMRHAFDHVSESVMNPGDAAHHHKWIVLSAHHAADSYLKMLLDRFDPSRSWAPRYTKTGKLPAVRKMMKTLKSHHTAKLRKSDWKLIGLLEELSDMRDIIMHRYLPEAVDPTHAAWVLLAMLRAISHRFRRPVEETYDQDPPIQADVATFIRARRWSEYEAFISQAVVEEHPNAGFVGDCPWCGATAVVDDRCQACFSALRLRQCTACETEYYVLASGPFAGSDEDRCPGCGSTASVAA